ncbi:hypothetical protein LOD99_12733 [Oopsacas minuta]|uniref:Uncharacterized protein n=1 Tax=Oopsacas minuta TaxID=111878 RepID=A0AAV7JCY7_9METZ|nr:hypothetical protein LOD99_12733 [Oopsacas minuta]
MCKDIPVGCDFTTVAAGAICPTPGGQGVLHIDNTEAVDYAFRKGKEDLDLDDLIEVAESDWRILTGFPVKDDILVTSMAETGEHCTTCGERLKDFLDMVRETKSVTTINRVNRKRRQTGGSESSGIFINPAELENDPLFHNGAYNIVASTLLILTSVILALLF